MQLRCVVRSCLLSAWVALIVSNALAHYTASIAIRVEQNCVLVSRHLWKQLNCDCVTAPVGHTFPGEVQIAEYLKRIIDRHACCCWHRVQQLAPGRRRLLPITSECSSRVS